ncbi:uncharacterized protein LOC128960970 [Oppia nitens]|uniref:uncharacterized protein LOC128960970 n=1 Tax=Oppia nitens TaxID=1686743 RepID=UPI0023D9E8E3|nr:uncharacterized protein LOC128960970 [Oppia nitens]
MNQTFVNNHRNSRFGNGGHHHQQDGRPHRNSSGYYYRGGDRSLGTGGDRNNVGGGGGGGGQFYRSNGSQGYYREARGDYRNGPKQLYNNYAPNFEPTTGQTTQMPGIAVTRNRSTTPVFVANDNNLEMISDSASITSASDVPKDKSLSADMIAEDLKQLNLNGSVKLNEEVNNNPTPEVTNVTDAVNNMEIKLPEETKSDLTFVNKSAPNQPIIRNQRSYSVSDSQGRFSKPKKSSDTLHLNQINRNKFYPHDRPLNNSAGGIKYDNNDKRQYAKPRSLATSPQKQMQRNSLPNDGFINTNAGGGGGGGYIPYSAPYPVNGYVPQRFNGLPDGISGQYYSSGTSMRNIVQPMPLNMPLNLISNIPMANDKHKEMVKQMSDSSLQSLPQQTSGDQIVLKPFNPPLDGPTPPLYFGVFQNHPIEGWHFICWFPSNIAPLRLEHNPLGQLLVPCNCIDVGQQQYMMSPLPPPPPPQPPVPCLPPQHCQQY